MSDEIPREVDMSGRRVIDHPKIRAIDEITTLRERVRELELLTQSMHPDNAPKDAWPLMLYFGSDEDRQEFIKVTEKAIPGMWVEALRKT